jgi:cobalt-zinc-cadmium efflux system outer membrane protein
MRSKTLALGAALCMGLVVARAQSPTTPMAPPAPTTELRPLTLDEALRQASAASPVLRAKQAQLSAVEGAQADAAAFFRSNPEISTSGTRREVPQTGAGSDRYREWNAGISQAIEIGGQRGHRREATTAAAAALNAEVIDVERQVRAEVSERFYKVLALQQRVELEGRAVSLFETTAEAVQKRRAAGEDTRLDANVASVEAERARNQLAVAQEQLLDARSDLAAKLQLLPQTLPLAMGELAIGTRTVGLPELIEAATMHPRVRALAERERAADARVRLERANRYPDITAGVSIGREGPGTGRERLTTFSVSVPLPFFNRNQGPIGQALTDRSQAELDRQTTTRDLHGNVIALFAKLASLEARVRRLQESVLPALEDNQQLSQRSRRAGQIGLLELIVVNRQALDARRDLIDAMTEYHAARIALELAAGPSLQGIPRNDHRQE